MKATDSISVLLGLVWMQGNPGGSAHFPRPNKSRVELARGNPPHRLVIDRGGGPRPFHVVPWEIHPLVETSGTDSSSRSRLATEKATAERRRVGASKVRLFLRRRPNSRAGLYQSHRLHVPLLSHLSSLWRSCQIPEGIGLITLSPDVETSRSTEDLTAKVNLQLRIDTN
jgi:hypothetical protein